jgi:uncharacterized protein (DUF2141 family)
LTRNILWLASAAVAAALAGPAAWAQNAARAAADSHTCTLRIHVDGFRNTRGNLGTAVFASADGWPEDMSKSYRYGPAPIDTSNRTAVADWQLPPGTYGLVAIHDENGNARLDRNFLGIPKEGFGFANNPRVIIGPAPFRVALVHVTCPATDITIHLIYK